jgi:hypothetical protein
MTINRPITTSFPLGLFCNASWSLAPRRAPPETELTPLPLDRELLDMPAIVPGSDGLDDDLYWTVDQSDRPPGI